MRQSIIRISFLAVGLLGISTTMHAQSRNFVRTWAATTPETDPLTLMGNDIEKVKQATVYIDGLGRQEQTVIKKGSLSASGNKDLVTASLYDKYGREVEKYMPFVSTANDGLYKSDAKNTST